MGHQGPLPLWCPRAWTTLKLLRPLPKNALAQASAVETAGRHCTSIAPISSEASTAQYSQRVSTDTARRRPVDGGASWTQPTRGGQSVPGWRPLHGLALGGHLCRFAAQQTASTDSPPKFRRGRTAGWLALDIVSSSTSSHRSARTRRTATDNGFCRPGRW